MAADNIVKQGYLKKGSNGWNRLSDLFRRSNNQKWFVFMVRHRLPYLEYYDNETDVFRHEAINTFDLSRCQSVKIMGGGLGNVAPNTFCVVCPDRVIELIAASRPQMLEWVTELESGLRRLGVLKTQTDDHVYTMCPAVVRQPRVSAEVLEEREREAAAAIADSVPDTPTMAEIPPPLPPSRRSNSTLLYQGSSQMNELQQHHSSVLTQSGASANIIHGSEDELLSNAEALKILNESNESLPPQEQAPLPPIGVFPFQKVAKAATDSPSYCGSSNDSDFVPAELLMQIKKSYEQRMSSVDCIDSSIHIPKHQCEPPSVLIDSTDDISPPNRMKPDVLPKPERLKNSASSDSSSSLDKLSDSGSLSQSPSTGMGLVLSEMATKHLNQEVEDNIYTMLPCNIPLMEEVNDDEKDETKIHSDLFKTEESGDIEHDSNRCPHPLLSITDDEDEEINPQNDICKTQQYNEISTWKPTPRPRRAVSNKIKKLPFDSPNTSMLVSQMPNAFQSRSEDGSLDNVYSDLSMIKNISVYDVKNNIEADGDTEIAIPSVKCDEKSSKDENENFYSGLPTIPPLPTPIDFPSSDSNKSSTLPSRLSVSCASQVSTLASPSSLSSSLHKLNEIDQNIKKAGAPLSLPEMIPPPLPRRRAGLMQRNSRNSLPPTAITSIDIPPLPQRNKLSRNKHPPQRSITLEDSDYRPPLPSRNLSQSFNVKCPRTVEAVSVVAEAGTTYSTDSKESAVGDQAKATSNNGLSHKMLLDRAHSMHTVVSLKQTQADLLLQEIQSRSILLSLTQKSGHGLALVDWEDTVCIVGWNQKDFPSLHGKLHVGDFIISINKVKVTTAEVAYKLLKNASEPKIELELQRMPHGTVFAIRRNAEGENLGFKRDGGTGEIVYVDPNGLAASHGLQPYASSVSRTGAGSRCNWVLTEINNRPLSLFFKDNEIDHRLSAVGREISIVVQPSDFIHDIKRKFKKLKNYKNFITQ